MRLRQQGYRVWTLAIPETITPKNRLLLGAPTESASRVSRMIARLSFVLFLLSSGPRYKSPPLSLFPSPRRGGFFRGHWQPLAQSLPGGVADGRAGAHAQIVRSADGVWRIRCGGAPGWTQMINALRIDLAQVRLDVVHALDAAVGLETVTASMAERRGAIAAINGGYFRTTGTFRVIPPARCRSTARCSASRDRGRVAVGSRKRARARNKARARAPETRRRLARRCDAVDLRPRHVGRDDRCGRTEGRSMASIVRAAPTRWCCSRRRFIRRR